MQLTLLDPGRQQEKTEPVYGGDLPGKFVNHLSSYQDGAFWWAKTYQPRVVNVSMPGFLEGTRVPSDTAFMATAPYTAAINWRQAEKLIESRQ